MKCKKAKSAVLFICHIVNDESIWRFNDLKRSIDELPDHELWWIMDANSADAQKISSLDVQYFMFSYQLFAEQMPHMLLKHDYKQNMTPGAVFCFWKALKDGNLTTVVTTPSPSPNCDANDKYTCKAEDYSFVYAVEFDAVSYGKWTIFEELKDNNDDLVVLSSESNYNTGSTFANSISNRRSWYNLSKRRIGSSQFESILAQQSDIKCMNVLLCFSRMSMPLLADIDSFCKMYYALTKDQCWFFELLWPLVAQIYKRKINILPGYESTYHWKQKRPPYFYLQKLKVGKIVHAVKLDINWEKESAKIPQKLLGIDYNLVGMFNNINIPQIANAIKQKTKLNSLCKVTILEIGAFAGQTTNAWLNCGLDVKTVYAVDPWDPDIDKKNNDVCCKNYGKFIDKAEEAFDYRFDGDNRVVKVKGTIDTFIEKYKDTDIDIVWIDGANDEKCVLNDIIKTMKFIKPKIAICGHDFTLKVLPNWHTVVNVFPWKNEQPESAVDIIFDDTSWLVWTDKEVKINDINLEYTLL